jgi:hypothetical protein
VRVPSSTARDLFKRLSTPSFFFFFFLLCFWPSPPPSSAARRCLHRAVTSHANHSTAFASLLCTSLITRTSRYRPWHHIAAFFFLSSEPRPSCCHTVASYFLCSSTSADHGFVIVVCPWCSLSVPFSCYPSVSPERRKPSPPCRHGRREGFVGVQT